MTLQWIGAILIVAGCGGVGFGMARAYKREENTLRQFIGVLELFCCELEYRMTPLPELFQIAEKASTGALSRLFSAIHSELIKQTAPDAPACLNTAFRTCRDLPESVIFPLMDLGRTLGEFDINGQLKGIQSVQATCIRKLEELENNRTQRIRSYQTLGLCAGAALAILFL